ncbi:MAG: diguanylate cyclase [Zetaproteobacteria bacterium]|nr:MAG: diguanylate cyclase [Zetaproteobacteria bacterium]
MPQNGEVVDTEHAIEIAERVWWVGNYLEDDLFQCHTYLIEHGDQSVLIDPGSALTFPVTLRKVEEVTSFDHIRYFICHHQDPDITASLPRIDAMISRDDAVIVSHWRAVALLRHYGLKTPFWQIEEHDWQLDLGGRWLTFVLTPYLHFPGAFCTYDTRSRTLFSSDIFGGFTETWTLFARDERYFESIRAFHEHYMPGREILQHAMEKFDAMEIDTIAPQHGSMIPKPLVKFMINRLKGLECGLFMNSDQGESALRLHELNRLLAESADTIASSRNFREVAEGFLSAISHSLPVSRLEFRIRENGQQQIYFAASNEFRGVPMAINAADRALFREAERLPPGSHGCKKVVHGGSGEAMVIVPLKLRQGEGRVAVSLLSVGVDANISSALLAAIDRMSGPVSAALERELLFMELERERNAIYERSIRDALTGCYVRSYMQSTAERLLHTHNRIAEATVGVIFMDLDHFKQVNDTYGHLVGDEVLRHCGQAIRDTLRPMDVPVRYGGEEFVILTSPIEAAHLRLLTERLRAQIHRQRIPLEGGGVLQVTVSAGMAMHQQGERLEDFLARADRALYQAKARGRDQACMAETPTPYL